MRTIRKKVECKSDAALWSKGRERRVIVIMEPPMRRLGLRLAGEKKTVYLPLGAAYAFAAQLQAETRRKR